MQSLEDKIEGIEMKLRKLLRKAELLHQENKELVEENIKLKKELQENRELIHKQTIQETPQTASSDDINKIKAELDNYIVEVKDCIELLEA